MVQQAKRNRVRNLRVSKKLFDVTNEENQLQCNLVNVGTAPTSVDVEPILNIDIDLDTDPIVIIARESNYIHAGDIEKITNVDVKRFLEKNDLDMDDLEDYILKLQS